MCRLVLPGCVTVGWIAFLQTLVPPNPITPPNPIIPPTPIDAFTLLQGNDVSALNYAIQRNQSDIVQLQGLLSQFSVSQGVCDLCGQPVPLQTYLAHPRAFSSAT